MSFMPCSSSVQECAYISAQPYVPPTPHQQSMEVAINIGIVLIFVGLFFFFCKLVAFPSKKQWEYYKPSAQFTLEAPAKAVLTWNGVVRLEQDLPAGTHHFKIWKNIPRRERGIACLTVDGEPVFSGVCLLP